MKKYSLEIPLWAVPLQRLIEVHQREDIAVVAYGGFPNSPLNGGRNNCALDRLPVRFRFSLGLTGGQLKRAVADFYEAVTALNRNGISFRLAFTNLFVEPRELNETNLEPVRRLVEASKGCGVKNGVIINHPLLEQRLRGEFAEELVYVSSCTKYVSPLKILTPRETLALYKADCPLYDYVCLTPQDSRREEVLREAASVCPGRVIAIANSYCSEACNSYYHYERTSRENKQSLLAPGLVDVSVIAGGWAFLLRRGRHCSALRQLGGRMHIDETVRMQLKAGIIHFKLGRGFGDNLIDRVVSCINACKAGGDASAGSTEGVTA